MSHLTNPLFESEFELFKQSSYYVELMDDGSEWHPDIRAVVMAAYVDLILKSTAKDGPYVPEVAQFCYYAINQAVTQSEVHLSLYTDLLPEEFAVEHNPRKLFLAMDFRIHSPLAAEDPFITEYAKECEMTELVDAHIQHYPVYMHPLDSMPKGILEFLADKGYCIFSCKFDPMNTGDTENRRGALTLYLKNDMPNVKYKYVTFTYNHQVFVEDYQWISQNA